MKKQLQFNLDRGRWGGRRKNSGRNRIHSPGVAHQKREKLTSRTPVHVNFRYDRHVRTLRNITHLKTAILYIKKYNCEVTHWSFQTNHIHLILKAPNRGTLSRAMRSLTTSLAKNFKAAQPERYHLHVLKTPPEIHRAINYVQNNEVIHLKRFGKNLS